MNTTEQALKLAIDTLEEAYRQIDYLHGKFTVTGSGANVQVQIAQTLSALTAASAKAAQQQPMMPACGDLDCQACDMVPAKPAPQASQPIGQPVSGAELTGTEALIRAVIAKCKHAVVWGEDLATAEERIDDFTDSIVEELLSSLLSASGQSSQSEKAVRDAVIDQCKEALDNILFGNMDADAVFAALEDLKGSEQSTPAQQTESERLPGAVEMLIRAGHSLEEATKLIDDTAHQPEAPSGWKHYFDVPDSLAEKALSARVPGGSAVRDWFLPHPSEKAIANVRDAMKCALLEAVAAAPAAVAAKQTQPVDQTEAQQSADKWKQMAEYQYALRQYPNELELGQGALDDYFKTWTWDSAIAKEKAKS